MRSKTEPFEPGEREQGCVGLPLGELLEPRLDIAAKIDDTKIGAEAHDLRLTPQGGGADDRARRKLGKEGRLGADESIPDIAARQDSGDAKPRREIGLQIFHRVHRHVHVAA